MAALNQLPEEAISIGEAIQLGAVDNAFYEKFFFPKTVRQKSPAFHRDMDAAFAGPDRYLAMMIFRGGAKTTKVRLYISKKIAYAQARTIVVVGKSQDHARRTIEWIMTQVEFNDRWAKAFQLRKGKKWTGEEIEVFHATDNVPIRIIALGITGSTRGINVDDFRPDLILIDDPSDEENTATPDAREKTDDFINGSLRNSLAPESEAPHAKMILLQTLLNPDDPISRCERDPLWRFLRFSIFNERGESAWPSRWSTKELLKEKESFTQRGKLHLWMREMECKIVSSELSSFKAENLMYYDILPPLDECTAFMAIDPVPPPSDRELSMGLQGKDWEVLAVCLRYKRNVYLAEYAMNQGHNPDWTVAKFFELKNRWNLRKVKVESVAYQRTLKWLIEQAMMQRGEWVQIDDGTQGGKQKLDRRKKSYRIIDVLGSLSAEHRLHVHPSHKEFIDQYLAYPNVNHDDVIEAVAEAAKEADSSNGYIEGDYERLVDEEADLPEIEFGGCP